MTDCEPSSVLQLLPPPGALIPSWCFGNVFIKPNWDEATITSPTGLRVTATALLLVPARNISDPELRFISEKIPRYLTRSHKNPGNTMEQVERNDVCSENRVWSTSTIYALWHGGQVPGALSCNGYVNTEPFSRTVRWSCVYYHWMTHFSCGICPQLVRLRCSSDCTCDL